VTNQFRAPLFTTKITIWPGPGKINQGDLPIVLRGPAEIEGQRNDSSPQIRGEPVMPLSRQAAGGAPG